MSAVAVGVGVSAVGVGLGVAQSAGAFAPKASTSPYADYAASVGQVLAAPMLLKSNQRYNPKYAALNSNIAWQNMFGGNGAKGTLDLAEASQPRLLGLQSADRASAIEDVQNLGQSAYQSIFDYNPEASALISGANQQVQELLATRGQLDPWMRTQLQQNYRTGEAARGMAGGASESAMEGYYQTATQEQRQRENIGLANQQAGVNQGYYGDPFQQVLGRTSGGVGVPQMSYTANQPNQFAVRDGSQMSMDAQNARYASQVGAINRLVSPATAATLGGIASYFKPQGSSAYIAPGNSLSPGAYPSDW